MAQAPSHQEKGCQYWKNKLGLRCHVSKRTFYNAVQFERNDIGVIVCRGNPHVLSNFRFNVENKGTMPVNHVAYYDIIFSDFIMDEYYKNEVTSIKPSCEKKVARKVDDSNYKNSSNHNNANSNTTSVSDPLRLYQGSFISNSSTKPVKISRRHNYKDDNNDTVVFDTEDEDEIESDTEEPPRKRRRKMKASNSNYQWNDNTLNELVLATKDTQFWTSRSENCCRDQVMPNLIAKIGRQQGLTPQKAYRQYVVSKYKSKYFTDSI